MNKYEKYLSVPVGLSADFGELYRRLQNSYYFSKPTNKSAIICPFCIITDGYDLMSFTNKEGKFDIGFRFLVKKPGLLFRKTPSNFHQLIDGMVLGQFFRIFDHIDVKPNEIKIQKIHRAFYSLDKKFIHVPYFIVLPNNKVLHMRTSLDIKIEPINFIEFIATGISQNASRMDSLTKVISLLIANNQIIIPQISNKVFGE